MKFSIKFLAAVTFGLGFAMMGVAHAGSVVVPGSASIWLAGQPAGSFVLGYFGPDTAPANSPIQLNVTGSLLTFSATGSTSVDGSCFAGANGGCYLDQSTFSPAPWGGLYNGPADALIGIFLGPSAPTLGTVPPYQGPLSFVAGPDYQNPLNVGPGGYSPALDQIFLIGDGSGETFTAPVGATSVFLAVADSIGGSTGNLGSLSVNFTGAQAAVPEPITLSLFGAGLAGAVAMRRRRKAGA